jgi:hypothetical protein
MLSVVLLSSSSFAGSLPIFTAMDDFWVLPYAGDPYHSTLYGPTNPAGHWHNTQWNLDGYTPSFGTDLPPFSGGQSQLTLGGKVQATMSWPVNLQGKQWWSAQYVGETPTSNPIYTNQCGNEIDYFAEPNGPDHPTFPQGILNTPVLSTLSHLNASIDIGYIYSNKINAYCQKHGYPDQNYIVFSVVINNPYWAPHTFFYQIQLAHYGLTNTL